MASKSGHPIWASDQGRVKWWLEVGSFLKSAPHGGAKDDPRDPVGTRLAGKIARTPVAQRKTAVLGWLAGQGNDRAHLLGRDPIRPAATRRITQNGSAPPSREHRRRKAIAPAKRSPSCAKSPAAVRRSLNPKAFTQKQYDASPHRKLLRRQRTARIRRSSPSRSSSTQFNPGCPASHLVPPS